MGLFKYGARCCNNCRHWQCHATRKIRGNPPAEIYTDSNCDKCSLTNRSTLSKDCCDGFAHLYGASVTHALPKETEYNPGEEFLSALMEFPKDRQSISQANHQEPISQVDDDLDGEEEHELADRLTELGRANDRVKELLDEGMAPENMFKDKAVEFMHLLDRAKRGRAIAQFELAKAFKEGTHGALDLGRLSALNRSWLAWDWCRKAATQGHVEAQYSMGHSGIDGTDETIEWFRKAATQGHEKARQELKKLTSELIGHAKDYLDQCLHLLQDGVSDNAVAKAVSLIQSASREMDQPRNCRTTVPLYILDVGYVNDFSRHLEEIAENSTAELQNAIGKMYGAYSSYKYIVKPNDSTAISWFRRAAAGGCLDAMDNMGICFANGEGVQQDDEQAVRWYRQAAEGGLAWGQHHYACRLISGKGIRQDFEEGRKWMEKAAEQGVKKAKERLEVLDYEREALSDPVSALKAGWLLKTLGEYQTAFKYFSIAGEKGLPEAKYAMGICCEDGYGIDEDPQKAVSLYKDATKGWFADSDSKIAYDNMYAAACFRLGQCYFKGVGVEKSVKTACDYFRRASRCAYSEASKEIGWMLFRGDDGIEKCLPQAIYWLQLSVWSGREVDDGFYTPQALSYLEDAKKELQSGNGESNQQYWLDLAKESAIFQAACAEIDLAQYDLGTQYFTGIDVDEEDNAAAAYWWHQAAQNGNADAMYRLADCYNHGWGTSRNSSLAIEWYSKAANLGNIEAMYEVGMAYYFGKGIEENEAEAVKWFEKGAIRGDRRCQCRYAECYYLGNGVKKNLEQAREWYKKSAEKGYDLAQVNLGKIYYFGHGVEMDKCEAFKWLLRAAEQGRADAQTLVGKCYKNGWGVEKDLVKAFQYYSEAANKDNHEAQFWVGRFHENGWGGAEKNDETAFSWYVKSAKAGDIDAICAVGWAYQLGRGVGQDFEKAVEWFKKGADKGDAVCMNNLARLIEDGKGAKQNYAQAFELFENASKNGCDRSFYHLGRFYENGSEVNVDLVKAKEMYQKAADAGDEDAKAALERLH